VKQSSCCLLDLCVLVPVKIKTSQITGQNLLSLLIENKLIINELIKEN